MRETPLKSDGCLQKQMLVRWFALGATSAGWGFFFCFSFLLGIGSDGYQTCVLGRHFLENEWNEPLTSRKQLTVSVVKNVSVQVILRIVENEIIHGTCTSF